MPELPEVELTTRVLKPYIEGKRLVNFWTDWMPGLQSPLPAEKINQEIEGLKVRALKRQGKVLFMELDSAARLSFVLHLRMSGALLFGKPDILSKQIKKKHVHFIWKFKDGRELWFRDVRKFGVVWYGTKADLIKDKYLNSLGPDALFISFSEFKDRIRRHRGQLKPLLLRQDFIAGLGNITVNESLWEARLHPKRQADSLSDQEIKRLQACIQKVLKRIIKAEGNTMRDWVMPDGRTGRGILYWKVYGRNEEPCLRCRERIRQITVGGRATYFCPKCQPHTNFASVR